MCSRAERMHMLPPWLPPSGHLLNSLPALRAGRELSPSRF